MTGKPTTEQRDQKAIYERRSDNGQVFGAEGASRSTADALASHVAPLPETDKPRFGRGGTAALKTEYDSECGPKAARLRKDMLRTLG